MHVIRNDADLARLQAPALRQLLSARIAAAQEYVDHFSELVFYVVVVAGDEPAQIEQAIGFSPLRNRFDGEAYGSADFAPSWDAIEDHATCYELVYVLSDDGSGVTLFIEKGEGAQSTLLEMCRKFTTEGVNQ